MTTNENKRRIYTISWKYSVGCYMDDLPVGRIHVFENPKAAGDFVKSDDKNTYIDSKDAYKLMRHYIKCFFGTTEFENTGEMVEAYERCFQF